MKVSVAWIFDHIEYDWKKVNIKQLVEKFNQTTAEIEKWYEVAIDLDALSLAQVKKIDNQITVFCPEWDRECVLPMRSDANEGDWFMIAMINNACTWAPLSVWRSEKEGLIPAIDVSKKSEKGEWKKNFENNDYILEVDNKSITHRPDLWGHRGFAREIAAMFNFQMKPLADFVTKKEMNRHEKKSTSTEQQPFALSIATDDCSRFAGLFVDKVAFKPTFKWMGARLARVGTRPINALVDATNYVMLDIGHPMHAFDAQNLPNKSIEVRNAKKGEKLLLLDDVAIELSPEDIVITDGKTPVSLAGIMGGKKSGVSKDTKQLFLEAACFDATTIRLSAARHKVRTEAAARFEKSLDPLNAVIALERFCYLLDATNIDYHAREIITVIGKEIHPHTIAISHEEIEKKLGVEIESATIQRILERIDFGVKELAIAGKPGYLITVPSFRATKDMRIKEDVVEEVARFFGFTNITPTLPYMQVAPTKSHVQRTTRLIKHLLAFKHKMQEVQTYPFFDEAFLKEIKWEPGKALEVNSPVSQNWKRLCTTLVPSLLKAVKENYIYHAQLRFFQLARTWHWDHEVDEKKTLVGIIFDQKHVDFYDGKQVVTNLLAHLKIDNSFKQITKPSYPWYMPFKSAEIMHEGKSIGRCGKVNQLFFSSIGEGDAFIFELNADILLSFKAPIMQFKSPNKYPEVERDVSIFVPIERTVQELTTVIKSIDTRIIFVMLLDFFTKKDWHDKKALTFRYIISDESKTLTKQEIDAIAENVGTALNKKGATIR